MKDCSRLLLSVVLVAAGGNAVCTWAVILHPSHEPDASWTERPPDGVLGRWSDNATFVVLAPNWVITTRHQNTSPATVQIHGVDYLCHYHDDNIGGPGGDLDIRLVRLTTLDGCDPNLGDYTPPYEDDDEAHDQLVFVLGGYGDGRGDQLETGGVVYGYTWQHIDNAVPRWGTNQVRWIAPPDMHVEEEQVVALFDDPSATAYEAAVGEYDSGGGWFVDVDGQWRVIALTQNVQRLGATYFRDPADPTRPAPDLFTGVRVSAYADWIMERLAAPYCLETATGDLSADGCVDVVDLSAFSRVWLSRPCSAGNDFCQGGDIDGNHKVDLNDLAVIAGQWLLCECPSSSLCSGALSR